MTIVWTKPALQHMYEIEAFIAKDNILAAQKQILKIKNNIDLLQSNSNMGRLGRVKNTRELVVTGTKYIVAYRVYKEKISILAVFHGARLWPKQL